MPSHSAAGLVITAISLLAPACLALPQVPSLAAFSSAILPSSSSAKALSSPLSIRPSSALSSSKPFSTTSHSKASSSHSTPVSNPSASSSLSTAPVAPTPIPNLSSWFACPPQNAQYCLGPTGTTPILITCARGLAQPPTDCRTTSGVTTRCYATAPTAGDARCAEAPADAPPLRVPASFNGSWPAQLAGWGGAIVSATAGASASATGIALVVDAQFPPAAEDQLPAAQTGAPGAGSGYPYIAPGAGGGGGNETDPQMNGTAATATASTLGSTWAPQPTQPTGYFAPVPSFAAGMSGAGRVGGADAWSCALAAVVLVGATML